MKPGPVYYSVHALKDETIWFAIPTRKPRKMKNSPVPDIDEDGIHNWYLEKTGDEESSRFSDWGKALRNICIAMTLNVKRIVRQNVVTRMDAIDAQLNALQCQLDRIEEKLNQRN